MLLHVMFIPIKTYLLSRGCALLISAVAAAFAVLPIQAQASGGERELLPNFDRRLHGALTGGSVLPQIALSQPDAQAGVGTNDAKFSMPPDVFSGRTQMYVSTGSTPRADGHFNTEIILPEYTRGLSNRLVGSGVGISAFSQANSTTMGAVEALDLPDDLSVSPVVATEVVADIGGPFPAHDYTLTNNGTRALFWTAAKDQPWLSLDRMEGLLAPGESTTVTASFNANANILPLGEYREVVRFENLTSGQRLERSVNISIQPPLISLFTLDADPGWSRTGEWTFGHPAGGGGTAYGFPDPSNAATGINVFGINLDGDYFTSPAPAAYLIAGPFDLTGYGNCDFNFSSG